MTIRNLFDSKETAETIARVNQLTPDTKNQWGKMDVAQMLAHVNVAYDMAYDRETYPYAGAIKSFLLKTFVKKVVVGPKPYKRNNPTAPEFKITSARDFNQEKAKLIANLEKTQKLGAAHFDNMRSASFGPLSKAEWNVLFSKHIDHHLTQFGV